jgi:hypothetical protein
MPASKPIAVPTSVTIRYALLDDRGYGTGTSSLADRLRRRCGAAILVRSRSRGAQQRSLLVSGRARLRPPRRCSPTPDACRRCGAAGDAGDRRSRFQSVARARGLRILGVRPTWHGSGVRRRGALTREVVSRWSSMPTCRTTRASIGGVLTTGGGERSLTWYRRGTTFNVPRDPSTSSFSWRGQPSPPPWWQVMRPAVLDRPTLPVT